MTDLFEQLYPASFKGADFFYVSGDINGGRKTVPHEYPNQDIRFVEDLGLNPRTFNIRGVISGQFYTDLKAELEDKLNAEGEGILSHPFLGNITCTATGYTVSEDFGEIGVARYVLNFLESRPSIYPKASTDNVTEIADSYDNTYDFAGDDLNGQYVADITRNISFAAQKLLALSDVLNGIFPTISSDDISATDFTQELKNFTNNTYKIASPAGDVGGRTTDLIASFDGLSADGQTRFDASSKLLGFGEQESFNKALTKGAIDRNNNDKYINGTINMLAFTNIVDSAKDIDYEDEDQLNDVVDILDQSYDALINSESVLLTNSAIDNISEIRNQSRIFFEQKRLTVNKIIEIETKTMPMAVLAYQYYGDTDDYDELISLNDSSNPAVVSGTVKILEV